MAAINKVVLMGRLDKESRWGVTRNGAPACSLLLATAMKDGEAQAGMNGEKTGWHRVVLVGALAERMRGRLAVGDDVYVEGRLATRTWADRSGVLRYVTEIRADAVQVVQRPRHHNPPLDEVALNEWVSAYDAAIASQRAIQAAKAQTQRRRRPAGSTRAGRTKGGL